MPMKVGVTGASGFVGRRLVHRMVEDGCEVRVLHRRSHSTPYPGVQVYQNDLTEPDPRILATFVGGLDVLYHCAGEIRQQARMEALHIRGTSALLSAAEGAIGRWVQLSSVGAYGRVPTGQIDENTPERPCNLYEKTKTISDHLVLDADARGDIHALLLRPSAIIGPEMPNQSVFHLLRSIRNGRFFFLGQPGAIRNYIHVADVVNALVIAGTQTLPARRVFNLSQCCRLEDFVAWACEAMAIEGGFHRLPILPVKAATALLQILPGFPLTLSRIEALTNRSTISTEAIQSDLGYSHAVPIRSAVEELCHVVMEH